MFNLLIPTRRWEIQDDSTTAIILIHERQEVFRYPAFTEGCVTEVAALLVLASYGLDIHPKLLLQEDI